jgi:RNA polymerase sigma factor (sigma-70 family)
MMALVDAERGSPGRFDGEGAREAFIHRAVGHRVIDRARFARHEILLSELEGTAEGERINQLAEESVEPEWRFGHVIADVLDMLSPKPREVWCAVIYGRMTHREVAEQLGISPNTVNAHYQIATRALRRAVEREREAGR